MRVSLDSDEYDRLIAADFLHHDCDRKRIADNTELVRQRDVLRHGIEALLASDHDDDTDECGPCNWRARLRSLLAPA